MSSLMRYWQAPSPKSTSEFAASLVFHETKQEIVMFGFASITRSETVSEPSGPMPPIGPLPAIAAPATPPVPAPPPVVPPVAGMPAEPAIACPAEPPLPPVAPADIPPLPPPVPEVPLLVPALAGDPAVGVDARPAAAPPAPGAPPPVLPPADAGARLLASPPPQAVVKKKMPETERVARKLRGTERSSRAGQELLNLCKSNQMPTIPALFVEEAFFRVPVPLSAPTAAHSGLDQCPATKARMRAGS